MGEAIIADRQAQALASREFAIEAARLLFNTRCSNVVLLDAAGVSPITDYMVIATGTSPRQMKTAADEVDELGDARGYRALSRVGDDSGQWIVADYIDVVVHIFSPDARIFYDLENLWGDARKLDWREAEAKK